MNEHVRIPKAARPEPRPPTRAAEGLLRWHWTTTELQAIADAGFFTEYDRFELIGGEMVPMSPKGNRHEIMRTELSHRLTKLAPDPLRVSPEPQFNLSDDTYTEPDILVHPANIRSPYVRGVTALLVIEIADSSLGFDLGGKASLYASFGVREYWVIDAVRLLITVHLQPLDGTYQSMAQRSRGERLVPSLVPELAISLDELGFDW